MNVSGYSNRLHYFTPLLGRQVTVILKKSLQLSLQTIPQLGNLFAFCVKSKITNSLCVVYKKIMAAPVSTGAAIRYKCFFVTEDA